MKSRVVLAVAVLSLGSIGPGSAREGSGTPPESFLTVWAPGASRSQAGKLISYRWDGKGGGHLGRSVPWPKPLASATGDSIKVFFGKVEPPITYGMDAPGYLRVRVFSKVNRRGLPLDHGLRLECTADPDAMEADKLCLLAPGEHEGVPGWNLHLDWPREAGKHYYLSVFGLWSFPGNEAPEDDDASWLFHLQVR